MVAGAEPRHCGVPLEGGAERQGYQGGAGAMRGRHAQMALPEVQRCGHVERLPDSGEEIDGCVFGTIMGPPIYFAFFLSIPFFIRGPAEFIDFLREEVEICTLDEILTRSNIKAKDIGFIWMDIEGYELEALKSLFRARFR